MRCSWPTWNALIVTGFKLLVVPGLHKIREMFMCRLRGKIREKHVFLFFQPGSKLIILWEIVIIGKHLDLLLLANNNNNKIREWIFKDKFEYLHHQSTNRKKHESSMLQQFLQLSKPY
jgi:hypothetical protein